MKLSIVIPVYNEIATLSKILERVERAPVLGLEKEIVLIDDGSTDGTRELLKGMENKYRVFYHKKNQGKGGALKTGFKEATGDIILIQDADLEYYPEEYPQLLSPILEGQADIVYGSRNLTPNPRFHKSYYWGGKLISGLTNLFYGVYLTDVCTCYKVFKAEIIKKMEMNSDGFDLEAEITAKILKKKYKITEVPISYNPRSIKQGKKIKPKDGLIAVWRLFYYRFFN